MMLGKLGRTLAAINENEDGHIGPLPGALVAAVGAILIGIGASNDSGGLAITGGIVAAVGLIATAVMHHIMVEYEFYRRLDALENKK
jgi:hypothetical protein